MPPSPSDLIQEGIALQRQGQDRLAEQKFNQVLEQDPANKKANLLLGILAYKYGEYRIAEDYAQKVLEQESSDIDALLDLGQAQMRLAARDQSKQQEAIRTFERVIELDDHNSWAYLSLIEIYQKLNNQERALYYAEQALAIFSEDTRVLNNIAVLYKNIGDTEQARSIHLKVLELEPEHSMTYLNLASLKEFAADDPRIPDIERIMDKSSGADEINLANALYKIHEQNKNYDRAWDYLTRANKAKAKQSQYSRLKIEKDYKNIQDVYKSKFCNQTGKIFKPAASNLTPIFILGMPRSGSTLAEQILSTHPSVYAAGEITDLAQAINSLGQRDTAYPQILTKLSTSELTQIRKHYLDSLATYIPEDSQASHVTNKMPSNSFHLGLIALIFPEAKVIHTDRDPRDVRFSCYKHIFKEGHEFTYDLGDLDHYMQVHEEMMSFWYKRFGRRIFKLQYENLVHDFDARTQALFDYLELEKPDDCHEFYKQQRMVTTASTSQVTQALNTKSIGSWQHYPELC